MPDHTSLDKEINDIVANVAPLSSINLPGNPWLTNENYIARLKEVHDLLDEVKNGGQFIIIASNSRGEDTRFFTANSLPAHTIARLANAISKVSAKIKED